MAIIMKFEVDKFIRVNDFILQRIKMKAFLVHQGLAIAISYEAMDGITDKHKATEMKFSEKSQKKPLPLMYLKKKLYTFNMDENKVMRKHLDDFNKIILDLAGIGKLRNRIELLYF